MTANACDFVVREGRIFDGKGSPGCFGDLVVKGGKVVEIVGRFSGRAHREIDALGKWVMPGFLDIHTHYDAEVEALPGLEESVRHGVTTVIMGNCSLSLAMGREKDLIDQFCRVENLPRPIIERWLSGRIEWQNVEDYYEHLETLPLGPNVATFLGHSTIRAHVMGIERSLRVPKATSAELAAMERIVRDAMEAGYLGLSIDMLPWHRMDGEPFCGISIPSQQAATREYRRLARIVRQYERVLQATPNALLKRSVLQLVGMSLGVGRKPLRTTIVAALDVKTDRSVHRQATSLADFANRLGNADLRFQALATPFHVFGDGVNTPLFEEFPTGARAIGASSAQRRALFSDPAFREAFRRDWTQPGAHVFHRDLGEMWIVASPRREDVGKSFRQVAEEKGIDPVTHFMDLIAQYDDQIRWRTVAANDRDEPRRALLAHPTTLPGFNDSGAHARNMGYQDGALQMLAQAVEFRGWISEERAVERLTGEPAAWFGLPCGTLTPGDVADLVVIDPERLKSDISKDPIEIEDLRLGGAMRMVRRSGSIVSLVAIGGKIVFENGRFAPDFGKRRYGRLLHSTHRGNGGTR